jgi:transcriptional regulator of acetoin/glycerol metabolism
MDRAVLRQALERSNGQIGEAARFLDMDRNTLSRKLKRLKVEAPEAEGP